MKFGPVALDAALGAVLAHSVTTPAGRIAKGKRLTAEDLDALRGAGVTQVAVARLDVGDMDENTAAQAIAAALCGPGLRATAPFTGRVNLVAEAPGILRIDRAAVDALNAVDEAITLATLPDMARVEAGKLAATIKIIPYGVPSATVERAADALRRGTGPAVALAPFRARAVELVLTRTPGMKDSLIAKGEAAVRQRLRLMGIGEVSVTICAHDSRAVTQALQQARRGADLMLVLGGSATSDRADVIPAAIEAAGGRVERLGMPVDPGNLLVLGRLGERPVLGLPGCVRSPALNGADWVLERLAAGIDVTASDIAAMGVGGLLKEDPARSQPRRARPTPARLPEVVLLASGASRRMGGADKLLRDAGGMPLLRRAAQAAVQSGAGTVHVVLPPGAEDRRAALAGLALDIVEAPDWSEGMAASLRAGLRALGRNCPAVIVALADMPDVTPDHFDRLIAAFDPEEGREICRAVDDAGRPGHPVLFGRRFFEALTDLTGDTGARAVVAAHREFLAEVPTPGKGATTDLDTPAAWTAWERRDASA